MDANGRHIGGQGSWGECKDVCFVDSKGTILNSNGMIGMRQGVGTEHRIFVLGIDYMIRRAF